MVKYEIIIYWSQDDEAFIAEVPELPGCAADGDTYQQALDNVQSSSGSGSRRPQNLAGRCRSRRGVSCSRDGAAKYTGAKRGGQSRAEFRTHGPQSTGGHPCH